MRLTPKVTRQLTNLGGDVIRSSAECFRGFVELNVFLAHSEICDLDVPILIQQHIVELQIAVNDAAGVQEKQTDGNFGRIKPVGRHERIKLDEKCRNEKL